MGPVFSQHSSDATALARDAPRNATGKFLIDAIPSDQLRSGEILELMRELLPDIRPTRVQVNRNAELDWHRDSTIGQSGTVIFGRWTGGRLEVEGEPAVLSALLLVPAQPE